MTDLMIAIIQALLGNQKLRDFLNIHSKAYLEDRLKIELHDGWVIDNGTMEDMLSMFTHDPRLFIFWIACTKQLNLYSAIEYQMEIHRNHSRRDAFRKKVEECLPILESIKVVDYNEGKDDEALNWLQPTDVLFYDLREFYNDADTTLSEFPYHINDDKLRQAIAVYNPELA